LLPDIIAPSHFRVVYFSGLGRWIGKAKREVMNKMDNAKEKGGTASVPDAGSSPFAA
jgi:hypothetical protein